MPPAQVADFSDLVESAAVLSTTAASRSLTVQLDGIPRLSRTLRQVSETSADVLRTHASARSDAVHADALRMLARRGFRADKLRLALQEVDETVPFVINTAEHRAVDGDAARLLGIQRAAVAARAADEARLHANSFFQRRFVDDMCEDLSEARNELISIMQSVVRARAISTRAVDFPSKSPRTPGIGHPARTLARTPSRSFSTPCASDGSTRRASFAAQARIEWTPRTSEQPHALPVFTADPKYSEVIEGLLAEGDLPSVATVMHSAANDKAERPHLKEIFAILANLASFCDNDVPSPQARIYAARTVLEDQFAELSGILPTKPRQASAIAVRNDMLEFVRNRREGGHLAETGTHPHMFDNQPLWAQVFYCFRVGKPEAALDILSAAQESGNLDVANYVQLLDNFIAMREEAKGTDHGEYFVGSLSTVQEFNTLLEEYRTKVWDSGDAYYRACYFLLARLEFAPSVSTKESAKFTDDNPYPLQPPNQRTSMPLPDTDFYSLFGSVEDYLWIRLYLSRVDWEKDIVTKLTTYHFVEIRQVQREVRSCGPAHFDPQGAQPLLYAFVLACTGMFSEAVQFLTTTSVEQHIADSVHIAMVLYLLGWREGDDDFGVTAWSYVQFFAQTEPDKAAAYLLTIRERESALAWIRKLVFETEEYELLLGNDKHQGALQSLISRMPDNFAVVKLDDLVELRRSVALRIELDNRGAKTTQRRLEM